jgi:hypothetical protein
VNFEIREDTEQRLDDERSFYAETYDKLKSLQASPSLLHAPCPERRLARCRCG